MVRGVSVVVEPFSIKLVAPETGIAEFATDGMGEGTVLAEFEREEEGWP
jgi:hypothetical protein